ncbi:hypothetical protein PoB_001968200 [Plakobranchus ocellatus]|uniref:Uncharacterized protein n=1 Tax=Plakobranchus ocellatus TaxID=259542 RepID=A0AAV3ZFB3_9GAST|nr:hypothetical protein PoB_001968200 [Plakobranchus ocellatus]
MSFTNRAEKFDYKYYEGPRVRSELQLIANDEMDKATLRCYSYEGQTSFTNPITGFTVSTMVSLQPFDFTFAVGLPNINKIITGDERKMVEAICSIDVGSHGTLLWELRRSDSLVYCWTVDANGMVRGNPPPFLKESKDTERNFNYTYNKKTGPHIISKIGFEKPKTWKMSDLRCTVDNYETALYLRDEDRLKMAHYVACENI